MEDNNQLSFPEDEEDLEALRLAALQSLKKKSINEMGYFGAIKDKSIHFNGSLRGKSKRGKFNRLQQGRTPRNGQFNGWTRNSNLIAVPMVTEDENPTEPKKNLSSQPTDVPKLILPQDRYCKLEKTPEKTDSLTSKFDRYDNSDESEEESEDDDKKSETEEKSSLKRSNSLEALMEELENEIQGVSSKPPEEKPKPKQPKKKRKISVTTAPPVVDEKPVTSLKENLKPEIMAIKKPIQNNTNFQQRQRKWRRPHLPSFPPPQNVLHVAPPPVAFAPSHVQNFPPYNPIGFDNGVYVPPPIVFDAPPPLPPMHVAPPPYERPLSPLNINTEAFSTTSTLAPLSPRSAAFVMENRAIIEKRKRRSYSRSPSPMRFRRSKSPKRLSLSPKSPKRRSLSPSPVRKVLPPKKPASVHERLGLKPKTDTDEEKNKKPLKEEKKEVFDPILEARRRKFERNEITMTEGVIRLKKPEDGDETKKEEEVEEGEHIEEDEEEEEELDEEALLEGDGDDSILLDHNVLFSDEESDSDNEGRFKTKQETNQKVAVLPFAKLMNGAKAEVKNDLRSQEKKKQTERAKNERRKRFRSRSPAKKLAAKSSSKKSEKVKQATTFTSDRKIEIKIRNPAKYEKSGERKVEVAKKVESEEKEDEGEKESGEEGPNSSVNEGDLRAQLSRKRAERQKHPLPDVVPSRLLQNALQGVGFRKGKKTKSNDENADGKLPIHLRLGAANSPEAFGKKSRKHKNKGSQEQDIISSKKVTCTTKL